MASLQIEDLSVSTFQYKIWKNESFFWHQRETIIIILYDVKHRLYISNISDISDIPVQIEDLYGMFEVFEMFHLLHFFSKIY